MIRLILSLFIPFRWFIEKMGADYNQFILILRLKLTLDDRRVNQFSKRKENEQKSTLLKQSLFQIFMGAFFGLGVVLIKSPFTFYYFSHTLILVMMAMMIISQFTTILFDTSENAIIQPLPIKGNTVNLARNTHIFLYLLMTAFNLSVVSLVVGCIKFGILSGLIFLFTIILNVLFTLFLTNILYLGIMQLASGERLKNLFMYFQVIIAVIFMGAYQIGMHMVDKSQITNMFLHVHWYTYLMPPAFFSGLTEAISTLTFDTSHLIFIAEALIVPPLAIYFTVKYLTPMFNRKLMDLDQGDRVSKVKAERKANGLYYKIMSVLFVRQTEEKAAFKMMWKITSREREFKQTFLPSLGYILIMIIAPNIGKLKSLNELIQSDQYLLVLYVFIFIGITLCSSVSTGNNMGSTWIFKSLPMCSPANLFKGTIKAAFAKYFIPFYTIIGIILCSLWGIKILPDVIIVFLFIYLITLLTYYLQEPLFPFTAEKKATQGGSNTMKIIGLTLLTVVFGFLHQFMLHWFTGASLLLLPVFGGAIIYANRVMVYRNITWNAVNRANNFS